MQKKSLHYLVQGAVIAALYVALVQALGFMGYGALQFRVAEALTVLPVFTPAAIPGLTVGCVVANTLGIAENPAGAWDILIGSSATLVAAILTRKLRNIRTFKLPVLATVPPVLINAVVVGGELTLAETGKMIPGVAVGFMLSVGLGQLAACTVLGLMLCAALEKTGADKRIFS